MQQVAAPEPACHSEEVVREEVADELQQVPKPHLLGRTNAGPENFFIGDEKPSPREEGEEEEDSAEASPKASAKVVQEETRGVTAARWISVASLIASVIAASLGIGLGVKDETLSLIGFGVEALLDAISSALVLWRFKLPKQREHSDPEAAARWKATRDFKRERNSGTGIGTIFVASSALLFCSGLYKLFTWDPDDATHVKESTDGVNVAVLLSLPSAAIFGVLAVVKFRLSTQLRSSVLRKDALCSVLGAILALIVGVAGLAGEAADDPEGMAQVDAVASMVIACILLFEGSRTLCHTVRTRSQPEEDQTANPQAV